MVLLGRRLCDELITRREESYRLWCVFVCDHENLVDEEAIARAGLQSQRGKKILALSNVSVRSHGTNRLQLDEFS
jgi:hypothetical protein